MLTIIVAIIAVVGWAAVVALAVIALRYGRIILAVEEQTEQSLDILDKQYQIMSSVLSLSLATDDVYARSVVDAIKTSQVAVLKIANLLVGHELKAAEREWENNSE